MLNPKGQQHHLSQLLSTELNETHQLLDILSQEKTALCSSNPDLISDISAKKLACVKKIEQQHMQRIRLLAEMGFTATDEGMVPLVRRLPKEHGIRKQWEELQAIAQKLKHQNEVNGNIIALTQRHITLALDILSGKAKATTTYGRRGEAQSEAIPQHLAKA